MIAPARIEQPSGPPRIEFAEYVEELKAASQAATLPTQPPPPTQHGPPATDQAATAEAEYWNVADEVYYADSHNSISNSDREVFRESPALYKGRILDKLKGPWEFSPTPAMQFGTAVHHALFATQKVSLIPPELLTDTAAKSPAYWKEFLASDAGLPLTLIPASVLGANGAKSTNAWKAFAAEHQGELLVRDDEYQIIHWLREHAGDLLLTPDEYNALGWMRDNVLGHDRANDLIFGEWAWDKVEQPIRWTDEQGLVRRAKLDRLTPDLIVDLKTFGKLPTARNWASRVEDFGYARQAAYYQDCTEALGLDRLPFVFVVVQTTAPFSCETFDMRQTWIDRARREVASDLADMQAARQSGKYLSKTHGQIITIDEPRWASHESEYAA